MAHGTPDYGPTAAIKTVYTALDLAELAARLGSNDTFDRRGNIVWFDNFESGIGKWEFVGAGVGSAVEWSQEKTRNDGFSAKLLTGNVIDDCAAINHYQAYPVLTKLGFEFSFSRGAAWKDIWLRVYLYDGSYRHEVLIRFLSADRSFYYQDIDGVEVALTPTLDIWVNTDLFNTMKLVVDFANEQYDRLIVNSQIYNLSGIKYKKSASGTTRELIMQLGIHTAVILQAIAYVDDVIITQNEP